MDVHAFNASGIETTGLEFDAIAFYDNDVEDKLVDFVDKLDPQNPSEEFKVCNILSYTIIMTYMYVIITSIQLIVAVLY